MSTWIIAVSCVLAAGAGAALADSPASAFGPLGPNAVNNGDFHAWATYTDRGVTTTSVGVPAGSIPDDWYKASITRVINMAP